jgi:formylglycine-generating enzyme required for sulfatase activity
LRGIISRCLAKDPEQRYQSADKLREDLEDHISALTAPVPNIRTLWRFAKRPNVAVSIGLVLLVACITALWLFVRNVRIRWAREEALPEIARLIPRDDYYAAFVLAQEAEKYIPNDAVLKDLWPRMSRECLITTAPVGAQVFLGEYSAIDAGWEYLGQSPLESVRVPFGTYRWRIQKEGFVTIETVRVSRPALPWGQDGVGQEDKLHFTLHQEGSLPPGMVWIPPSELELRLSSLDAFANIDAPAYAIDRYEVTNTQFKEFVDNGGYRNPESWQGLTFVKDGQSLSWEQAMGEFRDRTGRPGPSTWEGGTYPQGQDNYPVSGVSWFEAVAYARFKGKSLPTVYHWIKGARAQDDALRIVRLSNFGDGSATVGSHLGMGRFGLYDGAGNVREWCYNATNDLGDWRYCLGGAWCDSEYSFTEPLARSSWDRDQANGLRCAQYLGGVEAVPKTAFRPVVRKVKDFTKFKPVPDEIFRSYIEDFYQSL